MDPDNQCPHCTGGIKPLIDEKGRTCGFIPCRVCGGYGTKSDAVRIALCGGQHPDSIIFWERVEAAARVPDNQQQAAMKVTKTK